MQFSMSTLILPFVVGGYFTNASVLEKRLTRSKLDQFSSTNWQVISAVPKACSPLAFVLY